MVVLYDLIFLMIFPIYHWQAPQKERFQSESFVSKITWNDFNSDFTVAINEFNH